MRKIFISLGVFLAIFCMVVVAVNVSPTLAYAFERIPVLRQIAIAVNFSPSLTVAIEHDVTYLSPTLEVGEMRQIVVDFFDEQIPDSLAFKTSVLAVPQTAGAAPIRASNIHTKPENLIDFIFVLEFDPNFTQQGETIYLYQDFVIDGQNITLTSVEIYPTHMRINLSYDPNNTAWLRSLRFFAENEHGIRFDSISNGVSAFGTTDSPHMASHFLHSPFFAESEQLTLFIEEVEWLDKDMERVRVDLANGIAEKLPEGVRLDESRFDGQSWHLSFAATERAESHSHHIFGQNFFNEAGEDFHFNSWSSGMKYDSSSNEFFVQFSLVNFPYDIVYLSPSYSRVSTLVEPLVFRISR